MSIFDIFNQLESQKPKPMGKPEWLIVGLGNPGMTYETTRHNAGFLAIDALAKEVQADVNKLKFHAKIGDAVIEGHRALLMKPDTYMNNSGEAVEAAMQFYKIPQDHLLVLYDDISLDVGKLRMRRKGSAGGHNGIKSIIELTGGEEFPRIKIGVGKKPNPNYDLKDWVLSHFTESEMNTLSETNQNVVQCIHLILNGKMDQAMNRFNA